MATVRRKRKATELTNRRISIGTKFLNQGDGEVDQSALIKNVHQAH